MYVRIILGLASGFSFNIPESSTRIVPFRTDFRVFPLFLHKPQRFDTRGKPIGSVITLYLMCDVQRRKSPSGKQFRRRIVAMR
jgi:hypothetical protein